MTQFFTTTGSADFLNAEQFDRRMMAVDHAAAAIGAVQDDRIPGLWHAPGYPELTTGQLLGVVLNSVMGRGAG